MNLPYCYKGDKSDMREYKYKSDDLCSIIKLSGCRDDQTSADYFDFSDDEYQGALTNTFLKMNHYNKMHENIKDITDELIKRNFTQRPVLAYTMDKGMDISLI